MLYRQRRPQLVTTTVAIVEGIVGFGNSAIGAGRSRVDLGWAFHGEGFMRPFLIEFLHEVVEFSLLLQDVSARRAGSFSLQSQMHAFMTSVLLGMAGPDSLNRDS